MNDILLLVNFIIEPDNRLFKEINWLAKHIDFTAKESDGIA